LWAFTFEHAVDEKGEKIPVSTEAVTQGIVCRPKPFSLKLVQRDENRIQKVLTAWENAKEMLKGYPEGNRSTQYAEDWARFTENEKL
jgi:hypothetical protein